MAKSNKQSIFTKIFKLLYNIVISFVCIVGIIILINIILAKINENNANYKPPISMYTIVSPSMTPVIKVYDVVINIGVTKPEQIEIGDIITFKSTASSSEGMTITHRVIAREKLADGTYIYQTQGDNNSLPDNSYVSYDKVIGKKILIIPSLGKAKLLIANKKSWLLLLLIPIFFFILKDLRKILNLVSLKKKVVEINDEEEKIKDLQKEQESLRKTELRRELATKNITEEAITKSKLEPSGFLVNQDETIIDVTNNKYKRYQNNEPIELEETTVDLPKKKDRTKENIIRPKIINQQYEILDTDELTSKIKEYDQKINKLNKILSKMDQTIIDEDEVDEEETYLIGDKLKVIDVEETKNKRRQNSRNNSSKDIIEAVKLNPLVTNNKKDLLNTTTIIIRPTENNKRDLRTPKMKLNLNPKKITKVNRGNRHKTNVVKPK